MTHEDRGALVGGRYSEDIFDAIVRHTRLVPREVIGIGGAIYDIVGERGFDTVRKAVNAQASRNVAYAIEHSFLGWSDAQHRRFAASLRKEVIDGKAMADLAAHYGPDGPRIIKFFVQHGLLGTAEPLPQRHRHYYQQRFAFDEVHGSDDSSSVSKDHFFLHPAFKEWIQSLPEQLNVPFERLETGAVGDLKPFEAGPPLFRLGMIAGRISLKLRTNRRMSTIEKGVASDPLKFLYVLLWACKELKQNRINLTELKETWTRLRSVDQFGAALNVHLPVQVDMLAEKIRDWAKKINKDQDIRQLSDAILDRQTKISLTLEESRRRRALREPFVSVSARSHMGAQVEIWLQRLPINELDWSEATFPLIKARIR